MRQGATLPPPPPLRLQSRTNYVLCSMMPLPETQVPGSFRPVGWHADAMTRASRLTKPSTGHLSLLSTPLLTATTCILSPLLPSASPPAAAAAAEHFPLTQWHGRTTTRRMRPTAMRCAESRAVLNLHTSLYLFAVLHFSELCTLGGHELQQRNIQNCVLVERKNTNA